MEHFIKDEVDRIDLGEGLWVDIKKRMTYGDQQRLVGHYMNISSMKAGQQETPSITLDLASGNIILLVINIRAWNLKREGQTGHAPINEKMIEQLNPEIANQIAVEINKRNPAPKA